MSAWSAIFFMAFPKQSEFLKRVWLQALLLHSTLLCHSLVLIYFQAAFLMQRCRLCHRHKAPAPSKAASSPNFAFIKDAFIE
jgi:hypothetical protein